MKDTVYYEWDEEKDAVNVDKHGVSFDCAKKAFGDRCHLIVIDTKHSHEEDRYFCIGKIYDSETRTHRIVTVRFTYRGETIRIFGAGYWRAGKELYEKENIENKKSK